jgi:hypothetical protein
METVFITAGLILVTLALVANYMVQGIGGMASPLRQVGLFLLNKAPAGLIDLFNDKAGSGIKTWMRFGMAWFFMAALGMFLGIWHRYDPTALNSLASVGWSYDDGSMLTDYTAIFFSTALNYLLIGAALVAVSRSSKGRLASEASASLPFFSRYLPSLFFCFQQCSLLSTSMTEQKSWRQFRTSLCFW